MLSLNKAEEDQICIGGPGGIIRLYKIDKEMKLTLSQKFPNEHNSICISSLLDFDSNTLISSARTYIDYESDTDHESNVTIVIWSKSSSSSPLYKAKQRITLKETCSYTYVSKLVRLNNEEFTSFSPSSQLTFGKIAIWTKERRSKRDEEQIFHIKKQIKMKGDTCFIYISTIEEFIIGYSNSPFPSGHSIQIYYSSFLFKIQELETSSYSPVISLVELSSNSNKFDVKFASGHVNGEINIWSKRNSRGYSHLKEIFTSFRRLPNNDSIPMISDLLFIKEYNLLISCSEVEGAIFIYKIDLDRGVILKQDKVVRFSLLRNGAFASGGRDGCLRLWTPRFTHY